MHKSVIGLLCDGIFQIKVAEKGDYLHAKIISQLKKQAFRVCICHSFGYEGIGLDRTLRPDSWLSGLLETKNSHTLQSTERNPI